MLPGQNISVVIVAMDVVTVLLEKAKQRGLSYEAFYRLTTPAGEPLLDQIVELMAKAASRTKRLVFPLSLNYGESLAEKVASGFVYVNPKIADANFQQRVVGGDGPVTAEAVLVNFGEYVGSPDAVLRLDSMGLRAGVPKELADLSSFYPNPQNLAVCLPIVALGDSLQAPHGYRRVVCLDGASRRVLDLGIWDVGWDNGWWFLAFRKSA